MSEVGEMAGVGVRWWKTKTRCGLVIEEVSQRVAGDWLCHLAETSSHQARVKDERAIQVFIASRATIRLAMEPDLSEAAVGTEIKISCVSGELKCMDIIREQKYSCREDGSTNPTHEGKGWGTGFVSGVCGRCLRCEDARCWEISPVFL